MTIALAAALSLAAGASFAQAPQPGGPGPQAEGRHGPRLDPAQRAERHAQRLRDALQLRPDQEPALRALIAAMQPPPGERKREDHDAMQRLPTPQRLDRMEARMSERAARFRQHAEAVKRFYAQLTPAQQKAFDALPMMGMGHGGRGHGGWGHGMGGGPKESPGARPGA
jgi:Spy/CpxP family protein refolding chaperone